VISKDGYTLSSTFFECFLSEAVVAGDCSNRLYLLLGVRLPSGVFHDLLVHGRVALRLVALEITFEILNILLVLVLLQLSVTLFPLS